MYKDDSIQIEEIPIRKYMMESVKSFTLHNVKIEEEYIKGGERYLMFSTYDEKVIGKDKHKYDIRGKFDPEVKLQYMEQYNIHGYFYGLNYFWDEYCDNDENEMNINVKFIDSFCVCDNNNEYAYTIFTFKEIYKTFNDVFAYMITRYRGLKDRIEHLENINESLTDSVNGIANHLGCNTNDYDYDD